MWAVLFLLGCTIDSIGCNIFDENNTEYDDFHYGSYSYSDDDEYEDEYSDPVSSELPRVRRYDRMTHTVPTHTTFGLPEIKDALQMLMIGRNLSASDIKEQQVGGSQLMYPMDTKFEVEVSSKNAMFTKPTIEESIEIPIEFYEIKMTTKTLSTSAKPMRSKEQPKKPTRVYLRKQPTRVVLKEHKTANQYTIHRTTNNTTTSAKTTNIDFIDWQHEMIPFNSKNINEDFNGLTIFKNASQMEHNTIDELTINSVTDPTGQTQLTEETAQKQVFYYYEDKKSGKDVMYIDSTTSPVAVPVTRTKAKSLQTVFLYENYTPEDDDVVFRIDDQKGDEDVDGDMVTEKWSEEYDPLEYLLTDNVLKKGGLGEGLINVDQEDGAVLRSGSNSTTTPAPVHNCTTTKGNFDVEKFLELVANLTYDYYTNLTEELNMTLIRLGAPTCPTPTTVTTTTTTETPLPERVDYSMMENKIMGKCYVCGLVDEGIPWNAHCSDAFAGEFIPLSPVDASAKGYLSKFRKYCRYDDVDHYVLNDTTPRTIYGRWTGGCGVRWTDISGIYTQRTCRNRNHPTTGKHYASKRMSKLEMALANTDNGCIVSPAASLIPLSRGISLYARFHACVCTGSWCNVSWRLDSDIDVWKAYVILGLLLVLR